MRQTCDPPNSWLTAVTGYASVMSSAPIRKANATYEDLKTLPDTMVGQILDGELYAMPRPNWGHARATSILSGELGGPFDRGRGGPGGWLIVFEPELHFGRDVLVPDLAGWRRERLTAMTSSTPWTSVAPDWVCEVLSPSTASIDRVKKKHVYAREKVSWYWLIDPEARTLEALRLGDDGHWVEIGTWSADAKVRAAPFDAIELELQALWVDG